MSCFDDKGFYTNDNVMHLVLWNEEILEFQKPEKKWNFITNGKFNLKYILAIINSQLNTYYFSKFLSTDTLQGSYSSIYPEDIRQIPVKEIEEKDQQPFVVLVAQILELKKAGKDTQALEDEIDTLVYRLYDITPEERALIEGKEKTAK